MTLEHLFFKSQNIEEKSAENLRKNVRTKNLRKNGRNNLRNPKICAKICAPKICAKNHFEHSVCLEDGSQKKKKNIKKICTKLAQNPSPKKCSLERTQKCLQKRSRKLHFSVLNGLQRPHEDTHESDCKTFNIAHGKFDSARENVHQKGLVRVHLVCFTCSVPQQPNLFFLAVPLPLTLSQSLSLYLFPLSFLFSLSVRLSVRPSVCPSPLSFPPPLSVLSLSCGGGQRRMGFHRDDCIVSALLSR